MSVMNQIANYMGIHVAPSNRPLKRKSSFGRSTAQQSILIADYIHKRQVLGTNDPPPDRICETVGWLVEEFLSGNYETLSSITELLENPPEDAKTDEQVLLKIFDSMFDDGKINWGRIVSTYAFGVKYCSMQTHTDVNGNQKATSTEKLLYRIGVYVGEKLSPWIDQEGGWEAILGLFPNQEVKLKLKQLRSAGYLILTVGVGSLLNVLTS